MFYLDWSLYHVWGGHIFPLFFLARMTGSVQEGVRKRMREALEVPENFSKTLIKI